MQERSPRFIAAGVGLSVLLHGVAVAAIAYYGLGAAKGRYETPSLPVALIVEDVAEPAPVAVPIGPIAVPAAAEPAALPKAQATPKAAPPRPAPAPPRAKPEVLAALPPADQGLAVVEAPAALPGPAETESANKLEAVAAALGGPTLGAPRAAAPPRLVHAPAPEYPLIARRRAQQGRVVLAVEVDGEGRPAEASVLTGSGHAALDEAALRTIKTWRFDRSDEPKRLVEVPIVFRLGE